uniref:Retrovirus-related Pol polyprotein from transposon TNT 1-94-like beta-barrel domain-containing protein n=1 Tax=Peronospora matthiolae TaxID=2874970 RepID=A0AAV1T0F9_9STRA
MKRDCTSQRGGSGNEAVFPLSEECRNGWLIYCGASSHKTPHRSDLFDYETLNDGVKMTIANGKKLRVRGRGTVKLTGLDERRSR